MAGRALTWSWRGWLVPALVSALAVLEVWYPVPPERLGAWLKTLDSKGIMLVPLTTAMLKSKSG